MGNYVIEITEAERKMIEEALLSHGQDQFVQARVVPMEQQADVLRKVIEISHFALFVAKLKPLFKTQRASG